MAVNTIKMDEKDRRMVSHIHATQVVIAECPYPVAKEAYTMGALSGMLRNMAGLGEGFEASLFSPVVTEAIRSLLATIGE